MRGAARSSYSMTNTHYYHDIRNFSFLFRPFPSLLCFFRTIKHDLLQAGKGWNKPTHQLFLLNSCFFSANSVFFHAFFVLNTLVATEIEAWKVKSPSTPGAGIWPVQGHWQYSSRHWGVAPRH
jgi:hypothetical protein